MEITKSRPWQGKHTRDRSSFSFRAEIGLDGNLQIAQVPMAEATGHKIGNDLIHSSQHFSLGIRMREEGMWNRAWNTD